jgi:integrase
MGGLNVGPVAKNNHRRLIVALFNFAKAHGWLNKSETTAADALGTVKVKDEEVEIYTPQEMAALVSAADADFLPWLLLIGFGGIRREELAKGMRWETVDFARQTIIVPAAIAKTGKKRKIEIAANLSAWLAPYAGKTGPIFATDPRKRMAKVTTASGVRWKRNALRHSFGSYRMEATKNAGQVALEMGNSPAVVMAHYHEIVHADDAKAYWSIRPTAAGNVLEMPAQAA